MEELMHSKGLVAPVLTYLFHRLEARFNGAPTFLVLDEAWVFLDDPMFAGRIREWLKVLRKKNVSVIFATQSLADIADSPIAPAIIESCLLIASATPKRDYYFQSHGGNRLFDLQLGPVALAFCGAGSEQDHDDLDHVLDANGPDDFAVHWLRFKGLNWAADLMSAEFNLDDEEYVPWLDAAQ